MTTIGIILFALPFALIAYVYAIYPLVLSLLARGRRDPGTGDGPDAWPMISITVPVHNEEKQVRALLESLVQLDYPADRRQILIVSDASTDGTDEIVREFASHGVQLLRMEERGGKTAAENAARPLLEGEIIVNTDASIRIHPGALKPLVRAFQDETVGVASGRDVSWAADSTKDSNVGESGYVGYEMWLRDLETRVAGIVGASGCLYAIRRDLHMEMLPSALSRDFASALVAREHGYRAVSVTAATCLVPRSASLRREYRRKVRTMTRGLETLAFKRHLLNPLRHGVFAWMLFSHKLARWLLPLALVPGMLGLVVLASTARWAAVLLGVAGLGALLASVGWLWPESRPAPRIVAVPAFLVASTVAAIVAWTRAARGELDPIWEPTRREVAQAARLEA